MKDTLEALKKSLKTDKIILGTERSLKNLREGKLSRIYLSSNTPKRVLDDVSYYAKITDTEIVRLDLANDALGTFCNKPFFISVIGLT